MADFSEINQEINEQITTNGQRAITGAKLNEVLRDMISSVDENKMDAADFDTEPTEGSTNPVESGGVYDALGSLYNALEVAENCLFGGYVEPNDQPRYGDDPRYFYLALTPGRYVHFYNYEVTNKAALFYNLGNGWAYTMLWTLDDYWISLINLRANKVSGATNGHLASLTADGDLSDSGIASSDVATQSDLSGFITNTVNNLTNYYLKSETYTQAEVNALIGAIQQFHYEIYATLPQTGQSNVLYLIGPTGSGSDKYEEYVYSNSAFTKIGDTSIDLSGYVTTSALNTALAAYTTTSELTTLLSNKADKVSNANNGNFAGLDSNGNLTDSGYSSSDFATAAQGALADTAYQKPQGGIPESDLSSDVQQALQKHFKGWYTSSSALPANPVVGDYAYVKGAESTDPAAIYECTTAGTWSDSGRTADTSNVQTFASSQEVNEVHIVNDLTTGGVDDVLSAEQGVILNEKVIGVYVDNVKITDFVVTSYQKVKNNGTYTSSTIASTTEIPIVEGTKKIKFLGVLLRSGLTGEYRNFGYAFGHYSDPNDLTTWITDKGFNFDFNTTNTTVEKEYIIDIPYDLPITHFRVTCYYPPVDSSNFYCYFISGNFVLTQKDIANDFNGGVQEVLSAECGKELASKVISHEIEKERTISRIVIDGSNVYASTVVAAAGGEYFKIQPGKTYRVYTQDNKSAIIAILKNIDNVAAGNNPNFSIDYNRRIVLNSGDVFTFVCPEDAHYLYMLYNTDSTSYGVGKLVEMSELDSIKEKVESSNVLKAFKYEITLERGLLFGGYTQEQIQYYKGCMPINNIGLDNAYWQSSFNYIAAQNNISISGVDKIVLFEFDNNFEFIKQSLCSTNSSISLHNDTAYIKISAPNAASEVSKTWQRTDLNDNPSTTRIKTVVGIDEFDYIEYGNGMFLYMNFLNSNMQVIGTSNAIRGCEIVAKSAILNGYSSNGSGSYSDIAYIGLALGYSNGSEITVSNAGTIYKCTSVNVPLHKIELTTLSDGKVAKNNAESTKTINLIYPVMANDGSQQYSKMLVRFPSNYTNVGIPTKVIVFKTGSSGFRYLRTTEHAYISYLQYWVDMGYVVMDFHGATSKYPNDDSFGSPTQLSSASYAWKWLCDHYNVQSDWCYLASKSLGGVLGHLIAQNKVLPVRAYAALASTPTNTTYCFGYYADFREHFCEDAQLELTSEEETFMATPASGYIPIANHNSATFREILSKNILNGKLRGYLPMYNFTIGLTPTNFAALDAEVADTFANVTLVCQVPYRHWVAVDDADVPLIRIANYVIELQNAGCPATIRTFEAGCGAHHAVDNAANAPKVENVVTRLGVSYATVPVAYVEALEFLERY